MLPKLCSTGTQFLERKSIATLIALLDKKRNLVFIPTIAENPTSQMYEDEKGSSTFKASVERGGHIC
jgi:hypothetical protein